MLCLHPGCLEVSVESVIACMEQTKISAAWPIALMREKSMQGVSLSITNGMRGVPGADWTEVSMDNIVSIEGHGEARVVALVYHRSVEMVVAEHGNEWHREVTEEDRWVLQISLDQKQRTANEGIKRRKIETGE